MKKKIVLLNILLLALVFSSCSLFNNSPKMTIVNKSSEVISSIEIRSYIGVSEKIASGPSNDSLADGQTVAVDGKVSYNLPLLAPGSTLYVKVYFDGDQDSDTTNLEYTSDANFTLEYNGGNTNIFSLSGDGANFPEI